jgi:hypothetical protein
MSTNSANGNGQLGWPWTVSWPLENGGMPSINFAPERLWQPINPGWNFGNVTINSNNSSAPELEQTIVSRHSYGRQIGRLVEAVEALLDAVPAVKKTDAGQDFIELANELKKIRAEARQTRLDKLRDQLRELKDQDEAAWRDLMKSAR